MNIVNLQTDALLFHKTISPNRKQLNIYGACRVLKLFKEEDVNVVLSADNESILIESTKGNLNIGDKYKVLLITWRE